jgi:hypothetical protein
MLNATYNKLISSDKEEITFGTFGLRARQFDENINDYSPYQMWLTSNVMMFSDDGFASANSAFGRMIAPDGNTVMGINVDYLIGRVTITENLYVENANSSIVLNKDGATFTNCDITINKGVNTLKLNATDGIKLTKSGVNQFYIDGSGNAVFNGTITGGSMNINNRFIVDSSGNLTAINGNFTGNISGSSITGGSIYGTTITGVTIRSEYNVLSDTITLEMSDVDFSVTVEQNGNLVSSSSLGHSALQFASPTYASTYSKDGIWLQKSSVDFFRVYDTGDVICTGNITCSNINVSGSTLITTSNKNSYTFNPSSHNHSQLSGGFTPVTLYSNTFRPESSGSLMLGSPSYLWDTVYASTSTISTSDKNEKHDITDLDEIYRQIILRLRPVKFKYNNGSSNRWHTGFISQEVEDLLIELGLTSFDFAAFIKSPIYSVVNEETGEYDTSSEITGYLYGLRYEEFISPTISVVQSLKQEIDELKTIIYNLQSI